MAFLSVQGPESGQHGTTSPAQGAWPPRPFSFIRTVTVGFGFAPNLLTLPFSPFGLFRGRRSRAWADRLYRRWGISPRPENILKLPQRAVRKELWRKEAAPASALAQEILWEILMSPCREREPRHAAGESRSEYQASENQDAQAQKS